MYKLWANLNYRWAMVNAYLTQHYAPLVSKRWLNKADLWKMELRYLERRGK